MRARFAPLAVTTKERFAALPNVPPLADVGVPGFDAAAWQGVVAPAKTPQPILAKLNSQLNAIVAMDDVRTRMTDFGMIPVGTGSLDELQQFLQSEIVRWAQSGRGSRHRPFRVTDLPAQAMPEEIARRLPDGR